MRRVLATAVVCIAVVSGVFIDCRSARAEIASVEPEIVTGSRIYTKLSEIPAPTYVITAEEIDQSGATDLGALLDQRIPGIFLKKKTGVSQQSEVTIRGIITEILVLVDGIPYYRSSHLADGATVDFRSFPLENIERVEVVKGGGSALYGSMAAGGVINIITKKPEKSGGRVVAEGGSNGWRRYYVSGNAGEEGIVANTWYERLEEGKRRLFFYEEPEDTYFSHFYRGDTFGLNIAGDRWIIQVVTSDYSYSFNNEFGLNEEKKRVNRISMRHDWNDWYFLAGYHKQDYDFPLVEGRFYKDSAISAEIGGRMVLGEALAAWGLFFRYEDTDFSDGWGDSVTSKNRNNLAPFMEVSYPVGDWVANLGLRYEIWRQESNDHDELIPKISIQRQFVNGNIFYLAASRVFAMPSFYELFIESSSSYGNPDLEPERGWSYEVGYKNPGPEPWSIGLFFVSLKDKIKYDDNWPGTWFNLADFRSYGIEFSRQWILGPCWSMMVNGTWQYPEEKKSPNSSWIRSYGVPEWEIGLAVKYVQAPWTVTLSLNWMANQAGFFSSPWSNYDWDAGDHLLVNLDLSWDSGDDTIRLHLVNLFNENYTYRSGNSFYYGPERGFRLSWERRF
ncbi:MAG: TonB-dependent receptor [Thermovirga sp.]|jgi:iron complex outermembrane receptor protein/vitamin B12 transporter|nr:TonB-dependent receptor [Thermovirga sp.]